MLLLLGSASYTGATSICSDDEEEILVSFDNEPDGYITELSNGYLVQAEAANDKSGYTPDGAARVFDSESPCLAAGPGVNVHPSNCDADLVAASGVAGVKKSLIIQEWNQVNADDNWQGGTITIGNIPALKLAEVGILDIDGGETVSLEFEGFSKVDGGMGDSTAQVVTVDPAEQKEIDSFKVTFSGSGSLSYLKLCKPVECPEEEFELVCIGSNNPSGKNIPTAGDDTVDEGKAQNPDGFYSFGLINKCTGEQVCDENIAVTIYSGLTADNDESYLMAYEGPYNSCDTVKYTQFADGKKNTEKKIGSDPKKVAAHLSGSGDMVVKYFSEETGEELGKAYCKVPKPPRRFLRA